MNSRHPHSPAFPELYHCWMRIRNKMNIMENMPRDFGVDKPLYLSEIHAIQAIGTTKENNVRIIADVLGVTPSAASQTITRLMRRGFVKKIRGVKNEKEVALELTESGRIAYDCHEKIHDQMYERIAGKVGELSEGERATLARIFSAFESVYDERISETASAADKARMRSA
jgi:DNA-binding MarR family transcriptional regulator